MLRRFCHAVGLVTWLMPALAQAQTSIDAGKSAGEIFQTVCATCHKSARGLANGRGSSGLASFLAEHYTSGRDQAAQLAAYVMGAGGGEAAPRKPATETGQRQKPESSGASARLQPPGSEEPKQRPGDVPGTVQERGRKPAANASRGKPALEPEEKPVSPPEPSQATVEPAKPPAESAKPPVQESPPATAPEPAEAAPANADAGEGVAVPRDNIPD